MRKFSVIFTSFIFLFGFGFSGTIIDSVWGTALWPQVGHTISYGPSVDAILIALHSFEHSIDVHSAHGNLSYWIHDEHIYNLEFGIPQWTINTLASTYPYIGFTTHTTKMVAQRCFGWFNGNWEDPVNLGPDTAHASLNIPLQLQDGNILFITLTFDSIIYRTRTPDLQTEVSHGTIARACYFWGADLNNGTAYVFYFDTLLNIYYRTTADGINWTPPQNWTVVWPNPYLNNIIGWTQMAITDAGSPLLVFDNWNGDEYNSGIYPFHSKVYVSYASGLPCVEVSSTFGAPDTECVYPTIATGGNLIAVLYCMPRNNESGSLNWWDFYVVWSSDGGQTWGTPINCTQSLINRPGLPQLAKRIDTLRYRVYYIYAIDMVRNIDPLWNVWISGDYDPMYIYFDYAPYAGVEEGEMLKVKDKRLKLMILPSVVRDNAEIQFAIPVRQGIRLDLYDIIGRNLKTIEEGTLEPGLYSCNLNLSNLTSGIYFLILEGERESKTEKLLIVR